MLSWQQFLSLKLFRAVFGVNGLSTSLRQRGQNPETFKAFLAQILLYLKNGNFLSATKLQANIDNLSKDRLFEKSECDH